MKFFTSCSEPCYLCKCGECNCQKGKDGDSFETASKEQLLNRLNNSEFKIYNEKIKEFIKTTYGS